MNIPFYKAHGSKNDFLLTLAEALPPIADLPAAARAICERHTGIGADGWILIDQEPGIRLFNSDGSEPELSGNGTRCAAAVLIELGRAGDNVTVRTGAGPKQLRLTSRDRRRFEFEMNMGQPVVVAERFQIEAAGRRFDATLLDVGNPQCAIPVESFDFDWAATGREIESHPHFPNRTNVSFLRAIDPQTLEVRFFERGAGVTLSSGTGATGAAACALLRRLAKSPMAVLTPAGPLHIERRDGLFLRGPAEITAEGIYHYDV